MSAVMARQTRLCASPDFRACCRSARSHAYSWESRLSRSVVRARPNLLSFSRGMFANVSVLVGAKKQYLTIPQTAITYNPYGSTVFIAKPSDKADASGNKPLLAQQVFVTVGDTRGDQVAILKGIEPGQEVVTSGMIKLKNDTPLTIDNTVQPANSPNPKPQEN